MNALLTVLAVAGLLAAIGSVSTLVVIIAYDVFSERGGENERDNENEADEP